MGQEASCAATVRTGSSLNELDPTSGWQFYVVVSANSCNLTSTSSRILISASSATLTSASSHNQPLSHRIYLHDYGECASNFPRLLAFSTSPIQGRSNASQSSVDGSWEAPRLCMVSRLRETMGLHKSTDESSDEE
jgi:hypothetical protein